MPEGSLLSDDLVRDLMAVGQVDVLVGVPTLNNAATVKGVVRAVAEAFDRYFPRDRTVLLNSDGGSTDGTREIVRGSLRDDSAAVTVSHRLRTEHRISAPYHGLPGKGSALRQILTVAELTQARAVAVLDADVTSVTPEWVASLVRPVRDQGFDYVAPISARHPLEGPLISQLVRPLTRSVYGWRVQDPLAVEFGCSPKLLTHLLEQNMWDSEFARYGVDFWITAEALAAGFRCCEAPLGVRTALPAPDRPGLRDVFTQVVGAAFECVEMHASYWLGRSGSEPLPRVGSEAPRPDHAAAAVDGARLLQTFREDLRNLQDVYAGILRPETLHALNGIAGADPVEYPDALWVVTVGEFLLAHQRGVINRDHITRALLPLYLGRAGSFLTHYANAPVLVVDEALEALGLEFERSKVRLVEFWSTTGKR